MTSGDVQPARVAVAASRRWFVHPIFLVCLALALAMLAYGVVSGRQARPISSDGWGYYLPLPSAFIYGDLSSRSGSAPFSGIPPTSS